MRVVDIDIDIGVGTGLMAREAVKLVGDPGLVVGIDPSAGMMACARLPGVEPYRGAGGSHPVSRCQRRLPQHGLGAAPPE